MGSGDACMLHGLRVGEEAGAANLVFFRVKWLKLPRRCGGCGWGRFVRELFLLYVFCNEWLCLCA